MSGQWRLTRAVATRSRAQNALEQHRARAGQKTLAFMPQLSPDGQYAVATVNEAVYVANFKDSILSRIRNPP